MFIKKNVLTKDEIESGWISTNRAQLSWSFYILIISIVLILVNIALIYVTVRIKRSFIDIKNIYETNMNLINADSGILINYPINEARSIDEQPSLNLKEMNSFKAHAIDDYPLGLKSDDRRSSKKLKRIIDFIY